MKQLIIYYEQPSSSLISTNQCDVYQIQSKQGVSQPMICSFNLMQGKKGKETLYKEERDRGESASLSLIP